MLSKESAQRTIIVNGITYVRAPRREEYMHIVEESPSLFKVIVLGSLVPLFFLYTIAHLLQ